MCVCVQASKSFFSQFFVRNRTDFFVRFVMLCTMASVVQSPHLNCVFSTPIICRYSHRHGSAVGILIERENIITVKMCVWTVQSVNYWNFVRIFRKSYYYFRCGCRCLANQFCFCFLSDRFGTAHSVIQMRSRCWEFSILLQKGFARSLYDECLW